MKRQILLTAIITWEHPVLLQVELLKVVKDPDADFKVICMIAEARFQGDWFAGILLK